MKQKEIAKIVEDRINEMDKLLYKILKNFYADDIHDFRLKVKKLRAFLRLVHVKNKYEKKAIPKLLKRFYKYIGIIRNIQLHEHRLFEYVRKYKAGKPHEYVAVLDQEKSYGQEKATALMKDHKFEEIKGKIIKHLPRKIDKKQRKKFIKTKLNSLSVSINHLQDDTQIHAARKILKDLLYIWNYIPKKPILSKAITGKENLKSIAKTLGEFMDICIELGFMQRQYLNEVQRESEQKFLSRFYKTLQIEKKRTKDKILPRLKSLDSKFRHSGMILD